MLYPVWIRGGFRLRYEILHRTGAVACSACEGEYWVRFVLTQVPVLPEKPHGLDYSLTLHGPDGERLVGFDNADPVAKSNLDAPQDHRHRLKTVKSYEYQDAARLLADFWAAVDTVLRQRGVIQ